MNHSIIGRALLLGALLLSGVAHAETEDIPLPGDVQNAPVKTVKQSTRHQDAGVAVKRGGKEYRSAVHAKHSGHVHAKNKTGKLRKADGRSAKAHKAKVPGKVAASHSLHAKKYKSHKPSKNNNIKKNIKKKHKKMH
ncbi:hypothetical protein [Aquitalea sp. LB_tupeE]|uniref:hypothetical protein n=1 Tax=Aquitalea sp. LB_tupeE TaxID=2748078 RepID=UPI0015BE03B8|nr:hypothetical protein [Aquitalea sp. LB_tupeE]NWK80298.1 hypothetical protein [Aquitalea sp. LB_tupeE]